ncbi:MAG: tetratricopeptide repeat protein [Bacteroidia bacterium]
MKKLILSAALVASIISVNAQTSNRVSAYNYFKNGELVDAKKYIDLASENESTKIDPKTWMYRAQIYDAIYTSKDAAVTAIDADAMKKANEAWMKLVELDVKGNYKKESADGANRTYINVRNSGVAAYTKGDFITSQKELKTAFDLNKKNNNTIDTVAYYFVGVSAEKNKSYDEAKIIYKELIGMKHLKAKMYLDLENLCLLSNDAVGAKEALTAGRKAYPNDKDLIMEEVYTAEKEGKVKEAVDNVKLAIDLDPSNAELHYILGLLNYRQATPDAKQKQISATEKTTYLNNSDAELRKAIALNPAHYSALYQLGILYYNEGVVIKNTAEKIKDQKLYDSESLKAEAKFKEALPFMERAKAAGTTDKADLKGLYQNIKELYLMTEQMDKAKAIQEEMNKL